MPDVTVEVISSQNIASDQTSDDWFTSANNYPFVPPVNAGEDYIITLQASLQFDETETPEEWNITGVSVSGDTEFFVYTSTTIDTSTIQPTTQSPFDDFFEFVMPDRSFEILEVEQARTQGFATLKQWSPPSSDIKNNIHTITVDYERNEVPYQYIETKSGNTYFKYPPYTQLVIDLVNEGQF